MVFEGSIYCSSVAIPRTVFQLVFHDRLILQDMSIYLSNPLTTKKIPIDFMHTCTMPIDILFPIERPTPKSGNQHIQLSFDGAEERRSKKGSSIQSGIEIYLLLSSRLLLCGFNDTLSLNMSRFSFKAQSHRELTCFPFFLPLRSNVCFYGFPPGFVVQS